MFCVHSSTELISMNAPNWLHLKSILQAAMDLDPSDRVAFINRSCAGNPELRERVKQLLASPEELKHFIDLPPKVDPDLVTTLRDGESIGEPSRAGERLGPYQLIRPRPTTERPSFGSGMCKPNWGKPTPPWLLTIKTPPVVWPSGAKRAHGFRRAWQSTNYFASRRRSRAKTVRALTWCLPSLPRRTRRSLNLTANKSSRGLARDSRARCAGHLRLAVPFDSESNTHPEKVDPVSAHEA